MEDPLRPRTGGRGGSAVGDVVFDNFQERITIVLLQIEAPADYKIVEHANAPFARNQTVDKVAANKPSPPVTTSQPIEALVFFDIFETKTPRDWVSDTVFRTNCRSKKFAKKEFFRV